MYMKAMSMQPQTETYWQTDKKVDVVLFAFALSFRFIEYTRHTKLAFPSPAPKNPSVFAFCFTTAFCTPLPTCSPWH
jgi:Na+-transporting NADH:ubiquinone oxidoreductase subunit NqrB